MQIHSIPIYTCICNVNYQDMLHNTTTSLPSKGIPEASDSCDKQYDQNFSYRVLSNDRVFTQVLVLDVVISCHGTKESLSKGNMFEQHFMHIRNECLTAKAPVMRKGISSNT